MPAIEVNEGLGLSGDGGVDATADRSSGTPSEDASVSRDASVATDATDASVATDASAALDVGTDRVVGNETSVFGDVADDHELNGDSRVSGSMALLAGALGGPGYADGVGTTARFLFPRGLSFRSPDTLYVGDCGNHVIRRVTVPSGVVTTVAGSPGTFGSADGVGEAARFNCPIGIARDNDGNLYVADAGNATVRKVVLDTGTVTTLAGSPGETGSANGVGTVARFKAPVSLSWDSSGSLYIADQQDQTIRKVVLASSDVTTLAGYPGVPGTTDGVGNAARFSAPVSVVADGSDALYVADKHGIRKVALGTGMVTTLAGAVEDHGHWDGVGTAARFGALEDITTDHQGNLYVSDSDAADPDATGDGAGAIRKISIASASVTTVGLRPDGGTSARGYVPHGLAFDNAGGLYFSDEDDSVARIDVASGKLSMVAGSLASPGYENGIGDKVRFNNPLGVVADGSGSLYVADTGNRTIRKIGVDTRTVSTQEMNLGDAAVSDHSPTGAAADRAGHLFVVDRNHCVLERIALTTGEVTLLAGAVDTCESHDATGTEARFNGPTAVVAEAKGDILYVADRWGCSIRKVVVATGEVSTLAGSKCDIAEGIGTAAAFNAPAGLALDGARGLYVADSGNFAIRRIDLETRQVRTFAGAPHTPGSRDGVGPNALFSDDLEGMTGDRADTIYVADANNHTVRKINVTTAQVTTVVGSASRAGAALGALPAALGFPRALEWTNGKLVIVDENSLMLVQF